MANGRSNRYIFPVAGHVYPPLSSFSPVTRIARHFHSLHLIYPFCKMKFSTALAVATSIVLTNAQFMVQSNGTITCSKQGLAAYCAGGDIIVRCSEGIGHAANCNDNLAGEPPFGDNGLAGCYQSSLSHGNAACTKAGLVYPASGSGASNVTTPHPIPGTIAGTNMTMPARSNVTLSPTFVSAPVAIETVRTTKFVYVGCECVNSTAPKSLPVPQSHGPYVNATTVTISPVATIAPVMPQVVSTTIVTTPIATGGYGYYSSAVPTTTITATTSTTASTSAVSTTTTTASSTFTGAGTRLRNSSLLALVAFAAYAML